MKTGRQKSNWIVDATLFVAFIIAFWLDLTGVILHQWLGIAVGALAGYHLIRHWSWVRSTTMRLLRGAPGKGRLFYLLDVGVMLGMLLMLVTGVVISTWLSWPLGNYLAWRDVHVGASIATLLLVVLKIGLHWRWAVTVARRYVFPSRRAQEARPAGMALPVRSGAASQLMGRREFLKVMGIVGVAAAVPATRVLLKTGIAPVQAVVEPLAASSDEATMLQPSTQGLSTTQSSTTVMEGSITVQEPTATPGSATAAQDSTTATGSCATTLNPTATRNAMPTTQSPSPTATPTPVATQASDTCVVLCPQGCSYPGRCRRYIDANKNRRCDNGECL